MWSTSLEYIDCPACGAGARTGLAVARTGTSGTDLRCGVCGLLIWEGSIVARGREIGRETVIRRVTALAPGTHPDEAYREPWDRDQALGIWGSDGPLGWQPAMRPVTGYGRGRAA